MRRTTSNLKATLGKISTLLRFLRYVIDEMFGTCILAFSDEAIQEDLTQNFLNLQWLKMAASILMQFLFCLFSSSGYCCISAVATTSLVCARDIFASFTRPESSSRPLALRPLVSEKVR